MLFRSGASIYFNISSPTCILFGHLNFTHIENDWSPYFNVCMHTEMSFPSLLKDDRQRAGVITSLLSAKCLKYEIMTESACICRMNCLLTYISSSYSYMYLEGINCNEITFNTSMDIFLRSEDLQLNFTWKDGYPNCPNTPGKTFI